MISIKRLLLVADETRTDESTSCHPLGRMNVPVDRGSVCGVQVCVAAWEMKLRRLGVVTSYTSVADDFVRCDSYA